MQTGVYFNCKTYDQYDQVWCDALVDGIIIENGDHHGNTSESTLASSQQIVMLENCYLAEAFVTQDAHVSMFLSKTSCDNSHHQCIQCECCMSISASIRECWNVHSNLFYFDPWWIVLAMVNALGHAVGLQWFHPIAQHHHETECIAKKIGPEHHFWSLFCVVKIGAYLRPKTTERIVRCEILCTELGSNNMTKNSFKLGLFW